MLKKLMMLLSGKSLKEKFTIKPYQSFSTSNGAYSLTSSLSPESEAFTKIMSEYQYDSSTPQAHPYSTLVFSPTKLFDSIVVTRLDTGKQIGLTWTPQLYIREANHSSDPKYSGYQTKTDNDPSGLLFTKADIGKTIEITIEPAGGGLIGFFRRFVTFLCGGLRNGKKNDANEQHPIANWSRGIRHYSCLCNWNHQRNRVSKIIWSEWKFGSYRIPRAYDPISWLWQRRNENTRNTNHVWKCSVNLCENLYTKDRYPNNIKTRICTGRHSCLVKSDRFIFKGRCRQGNSFINPNRIASSALCAGGCHA